ncbi:hypothetical protein PVK06_037450 [Gossypium arboreum]|uniref:Uncharacterized protein n=1 Tax=Gossypium arboreum TaxID=29729 RepID=A0ABR0MXB4_GOSAR|nr:hypothetical protein PVK06_037450 [Gossypium arboreum]
MEADKTLSPSSDRVNREGLQGPRDDNSSWPVGTEGGDLNKNTVGFCSILQERCVIHAAWFSTADAEQCVLSFYFEIYSHHLLHFSGEICHMRSTHVDPLVDGLKDSLLPGHSMLCIMKIYPYLEEYLGFYCSLIFVNTGFWQRHQLAHTCSILMEGSLVETHPILEAGCVVPPGQRIPSGELGAGNLAWYTKKH